jgi:UDP-2,3-diacylglucosamine pyrophosphatase LpxH
MKYKNKVLPAIILSLCLMGSTAGSVIVPSPQDQPEAYPGNCGHAKKPRCVVLISDLHFGVGKDSSGNWDPTEDFRWGKELASFLDAIAFWGANKVDLVIAGDLFELWQPPKVLECQSTDQDYGCTPDEMEKIVAIVLNSHSTELKRLGAFADSGNNRLIVIPGNHDAALLLPNIWNKIEKSFQVTKKERLILVQSGQWASDGGDIVAEHGHQIGLEVNKWKTWPSILATNPKDHKQYLVRPWGEWFVQSRYNEREKDYPIIDNLSPESAGVRYYMADHGLVHNILDIASFLKFNIIEASFSQQVNFLGAKPRSGMYSSSDLNWARKTHGYKLFAHALVTDDPFRQGLLESKDKDWEALRQKLSNLAKDDNFLPDNELQKICAQLAIRAQAEKDQHGTPSAVELITCDNPTQGYLLQGLLIPRNSIIKPYLDDQVIQFPRMEVFVYGHTHELDFNWTLELFNGKMVSIFNTGAFQRVVDDETFLAQTGKVKKSPSEGLKATDLDSVLPACYSAVLVDYENLKPRAVVKNWYVDGQASGRLVSACDSNCSKVSKKCSNN